MTPTSAKTKESIEGTVTTSYGYDHKGNRVFKTISGGTTYYPFGNFEITDTGTTTKHIYMGDMLVATIEGSGAGALMYHNHLDHLGSTRVVTDGIGYIVQELDYYPYGSTRTDNQYGDLNQTNRFTGHDYDESTGLNYMRSRYQDGQTARFLSQDPASLENPAQFIRDPQLFNTYGYARNNPIKYNDPTGEVPVIPIALAAFATAYYGSDNVQSSVNSGVNQSLATLSGHQSMSQYNQSVAQMSNDSAVWDAAISNPEMAGLAVGLTSGAAATPAAAGVINVATIQSGVGLGYVGKMTVGAAAYEYIAANALRSTPDVVEALTNLDVRQSTTWGPAITSTGELYGPRLLGETGEAMYEIGNSTAQLAEDTGITRKEDKNHD